MDRLLAHLSTSGAVVPAACDWARDHQDEHGGSADSAILELELIDEERLLRELAACFGLPAATRADIARADPEVGVTFPDSFGRSFRMCPLRIEGDQLIALVVSPLPDESIQELLDLFSVKITQLVAPTHYLSLARERVYGGARDERTQLLEARLARQRDADLLRALDDVATASTPTVGASHVLEFAALLVEFSCFLVCDEHALRVVATRGGSSDLTTMFSYPDPTCTLAATLRHRGYFLGPLGGGEADERLFEALGRPMPRWAFVAPVPATNVVFFADNGPCGIATRWVAELTLLVSRLGQQDGEWETAWDWESWAKDAEAALDREGPLSTALVGGAPAQQAPPPQVTEAEQVTAAEQVTEAEQVTPAEQVTAAEQVEQVTPAEQVAPRPPQPRSAQHESAPTVDHKAVLDRLLRAASAAGKPLDEFVDELLRGRATPPMDATIALAGEVKGLFEKLAADIPTQLARGMEAAFRDIVPRAASARPPTSSSTPPTRAASAELVRTEAAPREVASYKSRRRKSKRVKL